MRRKLISTMAMLAVAAAVLLVGAPPAQAETASPAADVTAYTVSWEVFAPGHGSSPPLFAGMDMYEAACLLDRVSGIDCFREWGDVIINGIQCAASLFGIGRILMAKRIAKKIGEIADAVKRATATKRELLYKFLGVLVGECWDTYGAIMDLMDCWDSQETASLPQAFRPEPLVREVNS